MAEWAAFFGHWESWAYAGLVLITLASAYLSGRRSLAIGASYLAGGWVASLLIYWSGSTGAQGALGYLGLDVLLCFLFFQLSRTSAWAGYVFIVHISMLALHLKAFILPEHGLAYAWALNAAFCIACGIVITESISTRLAERTSSAA